MKKAILKEQEFEWISFHEFIEEIKKIVPKEAWVQPDMPWSGVFHGHGFTHEHSGLYLIGHVGYDQIRFHKEDVLCFTKDNKPFLMKHPLTDFITQKETKPLLKKVYDFLDTYGTVFPENSNEREAIIQREIFAELKNLLGSISI